ncbi:MAG: hypothetical protein FWC26_08630, partial [Fibromonadales bacterium]|nr:hypothetical protein [Fibromonadales bacterium]
RFYGWAAAMKACPAGWRLPSDGDWQTLVNFVGGNGIAGKKLKAGKGWEGNGNGTDDYGFSAFPGGFSYVHIYEAYDIFELGIWWSSTKSRANNASYWVMNYNSNEITKTNMDDVTTKHAPFINHVRCIKN